MTISFYIVKQYGVERIYIGNEATANLISTLTGRKCVTNADLNALAKLGHEMEHVHDPKHSFTFATV